MAKYLKNDDDPSSSVALPEDLLMKVLSMLPVKSLLRFRCLSKRWLDFISSNPHFIHLHSLQSKSKPPLLFSFSMLPRKGENKIFNSFQSCMDMEGNLSSQFEISKKDANRSFMLPTRLDLVCFLSKQEIHVCNPSTHELITLPPLLAYDITNYGFGYVESTDEYKIVQLTAAFFDKDLEEYDPELPTDCRVFTLGMSEDSPSSYASPWAWKQVGTSPYNVELDQCPAFVDGALHWVINRIRHPEFMNDVEKTILAFDLESEEFRLVPRPRGCSDLTGTRPVDLQLVELRGLLCLSCVKDDRKMDIWMLKDYHNGTRTFAWVKEYNIDLTPLADAPFRRHKPRTFPWDVGFYVPRDIQDDGNKVLIETSEGGSFHYDIQTASFIKFICDKWRRPFFSFYTESLRSLKYVLQRTFKFDQITGVSPSQSQQLAYMDPPIYIVRVFAISRLFRTPVQGRVGAYLTNFGGGFVAIDGKLLDVQDFTEAEAEAEAILCGLQFARGQGIQRIGLISKGKELVDAIITGERQKFQNLEKILKSITDLLSEFDWAQIFHDQRLSTQVACQVANWARISPGGRLCLTEPPEWFIDA